ncbi:uncharacterized protein MCAP_0864-like isoform X2 [Cotesia glomerata]|uniref:uncharacterized protein MCAP_0864-like isoform X2 n=1 Tax=Cotesia glomerata TaxID=32391 RepID=UPI001D008FB5|nr:uncharacterized protein MCAP_0864-like isoform X2 [Cotesia glomerata]
MDQKSNKRKNSIDIIQEGPTNKVLRRTSSLESSSSNLGKSNNQFLDRITAIWKTTSSGAKNSLTYEGQDLKTKIKEDEAKYEHAAKTLQSCQRELESLENNVSEFRIAFEKIIAQNQNLKEKHADALKLSESFTKHVSYINNTMSRCKDHAQVLEKMYKDVITKLREDNDLLSKKIDELNRLIASKKEPKVHLEQIKLKLVGLKIKDETIHDNILQQEEEIKKIISQLKINDEINEHNKSYENEFKSSIKRLEESLVEEEKKSLEQMNLIEESKIKEIKDSDQKKLSLLYEERNEAETVMNNIQEQKSEILKKYQQKKKLADYSEKKSKQLLLQVVHVKAELNKVTLALQDSNDEKISLEKIIDEVYNNCLIKLNEFELITREKSNFANELKILNNKFKNEEEETKQILDELENKESQLKEAIQSSDDVDKQVRDYQENKESKVAELKKELESTTKSVKSILNENKEIKTDKRKLEKEHNKESKIQANKYDECLSNLNNFSSSNDKITKESTTSKKNLRSFETKTQKLKEEYAKWQETVENKLKNAKKDLASKNKSEKQLKEELSKLKTNLEKFEKKRQQLKTDNIKIVEQHKIQSNIEHKSLSNIEYKIQSNIEHKNQSNIELETHTNNKYKNVTVLKSPSTYQSQNQPVKGRKIRVLENKVVDKVVKSILKPQTSLKSPKSPGRKLKFSIPEYANSKKSPDCFDASSIDEEYHKLSQSMLSSPKFRSSSSQGSYSTPASPATPTRKKFFKSRGTS